MVFRGYATPEGTARYAARLQSAVAPGHFREFQGLRISSIGLGTYLGEHDAETDADYREAIMRAVLRAGAYELDHRSDIPSRVVVAEYVDVANAFVDRDETGMVNAVLDQLARQLRPSEFGRAPG